MYDKVVRILGNRWVVAPFAAAVVWAGTGVVVLGEPVEHAARSVVALEPREDRPLPQAAMIQLLSTRYIAMAASPESARDVATQLDLDTTTVADAVSMTMPATTTNLELVVVTDDADFSVAVAEAYAELLVRRSQTDPDLVASVVVPANATGTVRTQARRVLMTGLAAGLGVGACVLALFALRRRWAA